MKIVKEGTLDSGVSYVIRHPLIDDAESACTYINKLSKERTFIRFQGEEISLKEEKDFIESKIKSISERRGMALFLVVDEEVQGICGIDCKDKTESHIGVLGLSVDSSVRGHGLGTLLMQSTLDEATEVIDGLRIVTLAVMEPNAGAISIYKKLGFQEYGCLPKGIFREGEFCDEILMYKNV